MKETKSTIKSFFLAAILDAILYQGFRILFTNNKVTFWAFLCFEQLEFDAYSELSSLYDVFYKASLI